MNLESPSGFTCISKSHVEYTTPLSQERYDNAFLSQDLLTEECKIYRWDVRREVCEAFPCQYLEHISNHCPVTLQIDTVDNDTELAGDWGLMNEMI